MTAPEWRLRFADGHWILTHTHCDTTSPPYPVHSLCDQWRTGHLCAEVVVSQGFRGRMETAPVGASTPHPGPDPTAELDNGGLR